MANLFLKLDTIAGESTDDKHKGEIEIESFSWGLTQTGSPVGGGGGAGKAQFEDLTLVAPTSSASPKLFVAAAGGEHLKEANLTVRKAGEKPVEFYKIRLEDVLVSSFHTAGAEGGEVAGRSVQPELREDPGQLLATERRRITRSCSHR